MDKKRVFWPMLAAVVALFLILSACGPAATQVPPTSAPAPANTTAPTTAPTAIPATNTTAPTAAPAQPTATTAATAAPVAAGPNCGTGPTTLNAYFETGFDIPFKLADEFKKQYPNVTWNIKQDQFTNLINETPRLLSGDNPPDRIRLPPMVSFAKQGLLKNLDKSDRSHVVL